MFNRLDRVFSGQVDGKKITCKDCADFTQGFCDGRGLVGDRAIAECIEQIVSELPGTCEVEFDDMGLTVTVTHKSPSGVAHPHMYGVSLEILKKMGRKAISGVFNVNGGCECDWSTLIRK